MGTHGRDKKGFGSVQAEPVPCGLGDGNDIRYSTAARSNGNVALGWFFAHFVKRLMNLLGDVLKRGGYELLLYLKQIH